MNSSYQPFPILGFKTGLYNYTESWLRPEEAFDPLENAFVYRSSLEQRMGYSAYGAGALRYRNNEIVVADGAGGNSFSGTLTKHPIVADTSLVTATVKTSAGLETFTASGAAPNFVLTGSLGDSGTLNTTSGAWTFTFGGGRTVPAGFPIVLAYVFLPTIAGTGNPIMGIKQWTNETTNAKTLIVLDTRRAATFNTSTENFDPLSTVVAQTLWIGDGTTVSPKALNVGFTGLAPYTVVIKDTTTGDTATDNGDGTFPTVGVIQNTTTVNYATGAISLAYNPSPTTDTFVVSFSLQGDYFTGTIANFFNAAMWKPTETSDGLLWLTNNKDRITTFDGTNLARPNLGITLADFKTSTNDIVTCLDIKVYKNRLLLLRATTFNTLTRTANTFPDAQSIRWSAIFNPINFAEDVPGNGGELSAPTGDWLQAAQFLRDQLIVFFELTSWSFRFTGNDFNPFVWTQLNNSKRTNSPYASVAYDERCTSVGPSGLIACDGVNVQRYDIPVIDQYKTIYQPSAGQCFSQRYDVTNQTWTLIPLVNPDNGPTEPATSNAVIIYNFLENTWSTATLLRNIPDGTNPVNLNPMCLGLYQITEDAVWADFATPGGEQAQYAFWNVSGGSQNADIPWNNFLFQADAPVMLLGDLQGNIWETFSGTTDNGVVIDVNVTTKNWNPFLKDGQRVQLGYIDFYYTVQSGDTLTISFYADNQQTQMAQRTLTLDGGTTTQRFAWKRIYCNIIGEFVSINIDPATANTFKILGMVMWARPSGRFTP